jgi:UDPglucose--hexose-1-phosphate uridylyltransferase
MRNDLFDSHPVILPPVADDTAIDHAPLAIAPEFRRDPVTGRWVIVAPERSLRPMSLVHAEPHHRANAERVVCPFCPGQEYDTPNEVLAYRPAGTDRDGPDWRLRVVPNKFPATRPTRGDPGRTSGGLFERFAAAGRHEVVVECPEHLPNPAQLPDDQFRDVFRAYRDRLIDLADDHTLSYAAVFKNVGAEAGASLGHTHSQIVATPLVPDVIRLELGGSGDYHTAHGRCVFCDVLEQERADGSRVIGETERMVAIAPFAPQFAYEVWVLPKAHASRYEAATGAMIGELAALMKRVVQGLDRVLAAPAYNWYLHTAPLRSAELPQYHWHFEIIPRTARPAGLEWGFGCFVTAVTPERAAADLRAALN